MMVASAGAPFGLTIAEIAIIVGVVGYVVSLVKDWRPMKALRAENRDLRSDLEHANRRISQLEHDVETWKARTDLTVLQAEHVEITKILERVATQLDKLDSSVKANTAATELVAKTTMVKDALHDLGKGDRT